MQIEAILNLLVALIIMLIVVGSFTIFSLQKMAATIAKANYNLYFEITRRSDLLPIYIELFSKFFDKSSFKGLIDLRGKTMQLRVCDQEKRAMEDKLWAGFDDIMKSANANNQVAKDLQLIALNKDLLEANLTVQNSAEIYNKLVKKYNFWVNFLPLKPLTLLFKLKKAESY
ncbi:LemA family protein [Candidatus Peregrinibacteria bacterium]|nr:LemA family protein [Candidatus Peregrinibacteria bacterium]